MARFMGFIAVLLGSALLLWVGFAMAMELPSMRERTPLKPILLSFVLLSAGVGWISHGDDEAELNA